MEVAIGGMPLFLHILNVSKELKVREVAHLKFGRLGFQIPADITSLFTLNIVV